MAPLIHDNVDIATAAVILFSLANAHREPARFRDLFPVIPVVQIVDCNEQ